MLPAVSAVIPTIGRKEYLDKAIASLLEQELPFDEVLIVDNSVDQNLSSESKFGDDNRVVWKKTGQQLPATESWNKAVGLAKHDYVFMFGDDDIALPNLTKQVERGLDVSDLVFLLCDLIDADDIPYGNPKRPLQDLAADEFRYESMRGHIGTPVPGVAFRKDKFLKVGGFMDSLLPKSLRQDDFLWFRMAALEKVVAFSLELCWHYRVSYSGRKFWFVNDIHEFDVAIPKFIDLVEESLVKLDVPRESVFPPESGKLGYYDEVLAHRYASIAGMHSDDLKFVIRLSWDYWHTHTSLSSRIRLISRLVRKRSVKLFFPWIKPKTAGSDGQ